MTDGALVKLRGADELARVMSRAAADAQDLTPAWRDVGEFLHREVRERFQDQVDPEGRPWTPLSDARVKEKGHDRILQDSGRLMNSITYKAEPLSLTQGTHLEYAAIHQFGGTQKHEARTGTARFRTDARGNLLSQASLGKTFRNAEKMRVFANAKHKRFIEKSFEVAAREQNMPARPFLGVNATQAREIGFLLMNWLARRMRH